MCLFLWMVCFEMPGVLWLAFNPQRPCTLHSLCTEIAHHQMAPYHTPHTTPCLATPQTSPQCHTTLTPMPKPTHATQIPDIYDSAKYDAIHNMHLGLDMRELYGVSKNLADAVIPNEYGVDPAGKLRIGSKIATEVREGSAALGVCCMCLRTAVCVCDVHQVWCGNELCCREGWCLMGGTVVRVCVFACVYGHVPTHPHPAYTT